MARLTSQVSDPAGAGRGADQILNAHAEAIRQLVRRHRPRVITCVDRTSLASLRAGSRGILHEIVPDIVVFDESFVDFAVPFSALHGPQIALSRAGIARVRPRFTRRRSSRIRYRQGIS